VPNGSQGVTLTDALSDTATSATTFTVNAALSVAPTGTAGAKTISATDSGTDSASTTFTVTASATGLTPTSGPVGTTGVTITAQGFIASHALTVKVGGVTATVTGGSPTNSSGSATGTGSTLTFTIPAVSTGAQSVVVSDGIHSVTSATNFTVTAIAHVTDAVAGSAGTVNGTPSVETPTLTSVPVNGDTLILTVGDVSHERPEESDTWHITGYMGNPMAQSTSSFSAKAIDREEGQCTQS